MTGDNAADSPRARTARKAAACRLQRTNARSLTLAAGGAGICAVVGAISLGRLLSSRASPGQLPGYAKSIDLDPSVDLLRLCLLVLLPALVGLGLRRFRSDWPSTSASRRVVWPGFLGVSVFLVALAASAAAGLLTAVATGLITAAVAVSFRRSFPSALPARRIGLAAVVANSILAWSFLAGPAAARGWTPLQTAPLLLLLSTAEALWIGRGSLERGASNFAASILALPMALWTGRPLAVSWLAGLAVLVLPAIAAAWNTGSKRRQRASRWLTTFVLLPASVVALAAAACLQLPPIADVFEDGHGLLPASEYLRGEKPYKDILPGHGFLSDGGVQVASLRVFGDDDEGLRRGSKVVGALFWPAIYFVGLAATGSASVGFCALLLSFLWFPQYMFFRVIASLAVLALASAASRTGRRGLWIAAGLALPPAILSSVDFASFAAAACIAAILVSRRGCRRSLFGLAIGFLPSAATLGAPLALAGGLRSFLTFTFVELRELMPVYALGFHAGRFEIRQWLSGWSFLSNPESFFGCALLGSAAAVAMLAARFPQMGQRARALAPVLAWFFAATTSVIERRHIGYPAFVLPILVVLVSRWIVGWSGWDSLRGVLAALLLAATVFCAKPLFLAGAVADALQTVRLPANVAELQKPRRARGALFPTTQQTVIRRTEEFLRTRRYGPSDTWLDFSNAPGLYYLFNRDCPIRYYEVPFYETRSAQDEVIRAVQANSHVRAVLVRTGLLSDVIDGVSNAQRAPRVAEFIHRGFHPAFSQDGVEFLERNTQPSFTSATEGVEGSKDQAPHR